MTTLVMPLQGVPREIYLRYKPMRLLLLCEIGKRIVLMAIEHERPLHQTVKIARRGGHLTDIPGGFNQGKTRTLFSVLREH